MALCLLGYPDRAWESAKDAVALAEELAHRGSLANALCLGAFIHQFRRDLSRCGECADAAVTLCREPEMPTWLALATQLRGYSLAARGQAREGISQMRQALAAVSAIGREAYAPYFRALLAEALGQVGQAEDGLDLLDEALAFIDKTGERFWEAEVHRLKGALLLKCSMRNKAKAEAAFNQGIKIARRQEAKLLELRAATSLARLWGENKKRDEAQALLAPVYDWFTEGFDTADLVDAKALLDQLN
jgi:predicted ATPase